MKLILFLMLVPQIIFGADAFQFRKPADNAVLGVWQEGGNVGIGSTDPGQVLDVVGTVESDGFTEGGSNTLTNSIDGNSGTSTALAANGTNCSATQAAIGVDASGNAEGCFTPAGSGDASLASTQTFTGANTFTSSMTIQRDAIGAAISAGVTLVLEASGTINALDFVGANNSTSVIAFGDSDANEIPGNLPGAIQFDHTDNKMLLSVGAFDPIIMDSAGNVGVGSTSPGQKLVVVGTTSVSGTLLIGYERVSGSTSGTQIITVDCSAGNKVLGGGCHANADTTSVVRSFPSDEDTWSCRFSANDTIQAFALCARIFP